MRKKSLLIAALMLIMSLSALTACGDKTVKHKVTFYDGNTVLFTVDVKDGEKITPAADGKIGDNALPTKTGKTFAGWYRTPTLTAAFDFSESVKEVKSVYAGFRSAYQNDTRQFAIFGTGKGSTLYTSNWGESGIGSIHMLTKAASTTENKYSITVDLFDGDKFQFGLDSGLTAGQRGFAYIQEPTKAGVQYFENGGQHLGGDTTGRKSDIVVKQDGNYTFTLTTNPADDTTDTANDNPNVNPWDTITWVRNGDTAEDPVETADDYFIKGSGISQWGVTPNFLTPFHQFSVSVFNQKYTKTVFLKQGELFIFQRRSTNVGTGEVVLAGGEKTFENIAESSKALFAKPNSWNNDIRAEAAGNYTFTIDLSKPSDSQVSATFVAAASHTVDDYYVNGKFGTNNWDTVGTTGMKSAFKLTETEAGSGIFSIANITFAAGEVFVIEAFTKGATNTNGTKAGTFNFLYMGASTLFSAEDATGNNFNVKILAAATYTITFNSYSKLLLLSPTNPTMPDDVYLNGQITSLALNWNHNFNPLLKFYNEGTASERVFYAELAANEAFGLVVVVSGALHGQKAFVNFTSVLSGSSANIEGASGGGTSGNIKCTAAGTYKIIYYLSGDNEGKVLITEHAGTIPTRP